MIDKKPIEELIADCKKYLPAYPVITKTADGTHFVHWGMSLRDYFAAQAMQGILAYEGLIGAGEPDAVASCAYELASAMLAVRDK